MFNDLRWEVIVRFVDIGGIVDHHCLNSLVIIISFCLAIISVPCYASKYNPSYNMSFSLLLHYNRTTLQYISTFKYSMYQVRGCHGRDRMVVGFTTTCAISAYHHWSCKFEHSLWQGVLDRTICHKVFQWLATGRWFSLDPPVSSPNKIDSNGITEILLKVALTPSNQQTNQSIQVCYVQYNLPHHTQVYLSQPSSLIHIIFVLD